MHIQLVEFSEFATKDRDNIAKPILDAIQGIAYKNDRQVLSLHVEWRDINGAYKVRFMSPVVAQAMIEGYDFVWIRLAPHVPSQVVDSSQGVGLMEKISDAFEKRRQSIARQYRREGYRVTLPERDHSAPLPQFLGEHMPGLIAESDEDRVIVEIKRVTALRGSNDLVDLARRVEKEPGWRLELVTLAAEDKVPLPTSADMASLKREIAALANANFTMPAFLCAWAGIEDLLRGTAARYGINPAKLSLPKLTRDLVTQGLMSADLYEEVRATLEARNRSVNTLQDEVARADIERAVKLAERLYDDLILQPA